MWAESYPMGDARNGKFLHKNALLLGRHGDVARAGPAMCPIRAKWADWGARPNARNKVTRLEFRRLGFLKITMFGFTHDELELWRNPHCK